MRHNKSGCVWLVTSLSLTPWNRHLAFETPQNSNLIAHSGNRTLSQEVELQRHECHLGIGILGVSLYAAAYCRLVLKDR